jgi:hypothetical protein
MNTACNIYTYIAAMLEYILAHTIKWQEVSILHLTQQQTQSILYEDDGKDYDTYLTETICILCVLMTVQTTVLQNPHHHIEGI